VSSWLILEGLIGRSARHLIVDVE